MRVELGKDIFRTNAEEMYVTPTVAFTGKGHFPEPE